MFYFKQKRAYVMRVSDWSSDVCSCYLCRPRTEDDIGPPSCPSPQSQDPARHRKGRGEADDVKAGRSHCPEDSDPAAAQLQPHQSHREAATRRRQQGDDRADNNRTEGSQGGKEGVRTWVFRGAAVT